MDSEYFKLDYIVSAISTVIGLLAILDSLSTQYYVMYANVWLETEFNLGFDPLLILLIPILFQLLFFGIVHTPLVQLKKTILK